jgi:hypothetical protein
LSCRFSPEYLGREGSHWWEIPSSFGRRGWAASATTATGRPTRIVIGGRNQSPEAQATCTSGRRAHHLPQPPAGRQPPVTVNRPQRRAAKCRTSPAASERGGRAGIRRDGYPKGPCARTASGLAWIASHDDGRATDDADGGQRVLSPKPVGSGRDDLSGWATGAVAEAWATGAVT